jgi:hypothetical protein
MWVTQAQVNRGQGKLQDVVFCDGVLYAQSNRATLEAIDAETGQKLWTKMIGQAIHPSVPPTASRDLVATINGSTLYVLNRYNGDILYQTVIDGAPGGGPGLSNKRAYVPLVSGMILAYRLEPVADAAKELGKIDLHAGDMSEEEKKDAAKKAEEERRENIRLRQDYVPPLAYGSTGRVLVRPLVMSQTRDEEFITWVTDRGYLYVGRVDHRSTDTFGGVYRFSTHGTFTSSPAYLPPEQKKLSEKGMIYAGSSDGHVYAVQERDGELQWKFGTSDPVLDSPVVIEDRVYVTTELGGIFCLNAKTGKQIWWAPDVLHFVAAGKQRLYVADKLGQLRILDSRNGAMLDTLPTIAMPIKVNNGQTDRIYLATEGGIIQCLREVELVNPVVYNESHKPLPEEEPAPKALTKPKTKSAEGAPKVARERPAPKKPAAKKEDTGDALAGIDSGEKATKPAKGRAVSRAAKAKAAKAKKDAAGNAGADAGGGAGAGGAGGGGDDPFGGNNNK